MNIKSLILVVLTIKDAGPEVFHVSGKYQSDKYQFWIDAKGDNVYRCTLEKWEQEVRDDIAYNRRAITIDIDTSLLEAEIAALQSRSLDKEPTEPAAAPEESPAPLSKQLRKVSAKDACASTH